jgi:hypothetical protein
MEREVEGLEMRDHIFFLVCMMAVAVGLLSFIYPRESNFYRGKLPSYVTVITADGIGYSRIK